MRSQSDISFRPLERSDFPELEKWLAEPHVKRWWHDSLDASAIDAKYGPRVDGVEPSYVFIILFQKRAIGIIQYYLWSDYPKHGRQLGVDDNSAGIDLAIGDKHMTGQSLGPQIITEFLNQIVFTKTKVASVIADPEKNNIQSIKAFKKSGFQVLRDVQIEGEPYFRTVVGFKTGTQT